MRITNQPGEEPAVATPRHRLDTAIMVKQSSINELGAT
jgi:hypothetical protein